MVALVLNSNHLTTLINETMSIEPQKNEVMILKNGIEVLFSHYEKPKGVYWFDTNGKRHHLNELA